MENLNKTQKIILVIIAIFMLLVIGYYFMQKTKEPNNFEIEELVTNNTFEENKESRAKTIIVHITGAIEKEGIVSIEDGARIIDVINKAGGTTMEADLTDVNLAYIIQDGQKIYIPSIYDEDIKQQVISSSNGDNVIVDGDILKNNEIVNINKASQTELETLNGIGPSTALKIVEYRKQNGEFEKIEDLMNIPGIGESKFEAIKSNICV